MLSMISLKKPDLIMKRVIIAYYIILILFLHTHIRYCRQRFSPTAITEAVFSETRLTSRLWGYPR